MASTALALKSNLIDELLTRLRQKLGHDCSEEELFLKRFYGPVAPDDVLSSTTDDLLGAALELWNFARVRKSGQVAMRIYNPSIDEHGWESRHTVIEITNDDMPFLVDSVTNALASQSLNVHLVIHPVLEVRRDEEGHVAEIRGEEQKAQSGQGFVAESWMHIEVDQVTLDERVEQLRTALEDVLGSVRAAVEDWDKMRAKAREIVAAIDADPPPVPPEERKEVQDFLKWIDEDYFTYLGYREYRLIHDKGNDYAQPAESTGLGILRKIKPDALERSRKPLAPAASRYAHRRNLLLVSKAHAKSPVHRAVHMDYIGVKTFNDRGEVSGEKRFFGLFTSVAYHQSVRRIPLLREKALRTVQRSGLNPRGHDGKALVHILETFPRDELFQTSEDDLFETSLGILQLQDRQRLALFVRRDHFEHFVSCLVYVPRERYDTGLRHKVQDVLEGAFNGRIDAVHSHLDDSPLARWHFVVRTEPGSIPDLDIKQIEHHLAEIARSWSDRLREALVRKHGEQKGLQTHRRYEDAFPTSYREYFAPETGLHDIEFAEELCASGEVQLNLYRPAEMAESEVKFKIYHVGNIPLSRILPNLENMGLKVISEVPHEVRPEGSSESFWIRDFGLETGNGADLDLGRVKNNVQQTFAAVWRREVESDRLNRLVVRAELTCRQVIVLRAYTKYLLQAGTTFSQEYMTRTLNNNPAVARLLIELFEGMFDPEAEQGRQERVHERREAIAAAVEQLNSLDEERIVVRYKNLILSTLRTNFYQKDAEGNAKPYASFKLDSKKILDLPHPRPLYEIWIYSPRFEAVHLRGGKVGRGGIRWSDRREDFRSEVLGLMKAQMVKNAVIVPVGAKGGFVTKRVYTGDARLEEGVACYRMMICGLLDITDNLVDGKVSPPRDVVRRDDDDIYLVVAADKGTATYSDIANEISLGYRFWLGDAFASGGSAGYDHKKMGITARGAFVSVQRHFREMGIDVLSQETSVVGVGDMSGDVFGNGLLQSRRFRLVGAFNHAHIFVDPDPDLSKSFKERKRLFQMGRSSWTDYRPDLLSEGGGIWERSARFIPVSPQMRRLFGLGEDDRIAPNDLIRAMLKAPVDLLWFGGIGTFVKSSEERNFDADDRANDAVRVDAPEVRAKVIAEGANLAFTQRGRIEYALGGGRINTDAIDNSAGVDVSDHEVNIKLMLSDVMTKGDITLKQRNGLLQKVSEEVASLVLRDNYLQTQAITVTERLATKRLQRHRQLIHDLEREGKLDRALEFLPDDEELSRRESANLGLSRPEIAVLLAYAKIQLFDDLVQSDLTNDPLLETDLLLYFPEPLRESYREAILGHRLRREIIATFSTNSMVNRVGPSFLSFMKHSTGMESADIARAYIITRDIFGLRRIWQSIEQLDLKVDAAVQTQLILRIGDLVERTTRWLLYKRPHPLDISANVEEFSTEIGKLSKKLREILPKREKQALKRSETDCARKGVPTELAKRVAAIEWMASAPDIVLLASQHGAQVEVVARIYFELGDRLRTDVLRRAANNMTSTGFWAKSAAEAVVEQIFEQQAALAACVLDEGHRDVDRWLDSRRGLASRTSALLSELSAAPIVDLSMLTVACHRLRQLVTAQGCEETE